MNFQLPPLKKNSFRHRDTATSYSQGKILKNLEKNLGGPTGPKAPIWFERNDRDGGVDNAFVRPVRLCESGWCWCKMTKKSLWKLIIFSYSSKMRIKQFVVTNCSKERPGSIVTKTLKNGILIPIPTSKESHFNADFKYISFIKFSLTHQKLRVWENLRYFRK